MLAVRWRMDLSFVALEAFASVEKTALVPDNNRPSFFCDVTPPVDRRSRHESGVRCFSASGECVLGSVPALNLLRHWIVSCVCRLLHSVGGQIANSRESHGVSGGAHSNP